LVQANRLDSAFHSCSVGRSAHGCFSAAEKFQRRTAGTSWRDWPFWRPAGGCAALRAQNTESSHLGGYSVTRSDWHYASGSGAYQPCDAVDGTCFGEVLENLAGWIAIHVSFE